MAHIRRPIASRFLAAITALFGTTGLPASLANMETTTQIPAQIPTSRIASAELSVMTYNVKGLPWPLAFARDQALSEIAGRLRGLRDRGRQPNVVLLQEAFTDPARRIGRESGYRYIASGPAREMVAQGRAESGRHLFISAGDPLLGEGVGKAFDSGLQILSDYPILAVRRAAFPDYACAGYDCLANKGVMMALIKMPGLRTPVAVINTHLNARRASGASLARSLEAYRQQLGFLDDFINAHVPAHVPIILAGDLNVGKSAERRALAQAHAAQWTGQATAAGVLRSCFQPERPCGSDLTEDARAALNHNKDWQIVMAGRDVAFAPNRIDVPFGREADGTMLSDHVGYMIHYRPGPSKKAGRGGISAVRTAMSEI